MCIRDSDYGIEMEYTARETPQQNGVAERAIAVIKARALAMMEKAKFSKTTKNKFWAEATNTATILSNIVPTGGNDDNLCADEKFYGKPPKIYKNLQPFGRVGYVKRTGTAGTAWDRRSDKCVLMGYANNHSRDTYRMYNLETSKIIETRDVTWDAWHGENDKPTTNMEIFDDNSITGDDKPIKTQDYEIPTLEKVPAPPTPYETCAATPEPSRWVRVGGRLASTSNNSQQGGSEPPLGRTIPQENTSGIFSSMQ